MRPILAGLSFLAVLFFGLWAGVHAATSTVFVLEKSRIEFLGTKPGGTHRGGFRKFTVDSVGDWSDLSKLSFRIDIDAQSIWSDNNMLTNHLKNSDFFDVTRHPNITFETTRVDLSGTDRAVVSGKLTMLGETKEVEVPCSFSIGSAGVQAKCDFKIDRSRWGMTYGKGRIDDVVEIEARFVFGR